MLSAAAVVAVSWIESAGNENYLYGGSKFPVKFCLPGVVSRPTGKHALRKLNLCGRSKSEKGC